MSDEWRPVVGFPNYEVNPKGEVRNIKLEKPLAGSGNHTSGKMYTLHHEGSQKTMRANRLVREAFEDSK